MGSSSDDQDRNDNHGDGGDDDAAPDRTGRSIGSVDAEARRHGIEADDVPADDTDDADITDGEEEESVAASAGDEERTALAVAGDDARGGPGPTLVAIGLLGVLVGAAVWYRRRVSAPRQETPRAASH